MTAWSYNPFPATPAGLHYGRFGLVPVRSPLLRESRLISSPPGTEMVQFPGFAHCSPAFPGLGFPIRTSPCQRSLASSTGLIAGSCVLHRLLVPRHPPCALNHLTQFLTRHASPSRLPGSALARPPPLLCECERTLKRTDVVEASGIEPLTPCLQSRRSPS